LAAKRNDGERQSGQSESEVIVKVQLVSLSKPTV
jgi:hypothetical protein